MKFLKQISSTLFGDQIEYFDHGHFIEGLKSIRYNLTIQEKIVANIVANPKDSSLLIDSFKGPTKDLNFLNQIPALTTLFILEDGLDLQPVNNLRLLKNFICNRKSKGKVDLENLTSLIHLSVNASNVTSLEKTFRLENLHYEHEKNDYIPTLHLNKELKKLSIFFSKIKSLVGIENNHQLKKIELHKLDQLSSLEGLTDDHEQLKYLEIFNCKSLIDISQLSQLTALETLYLQRIPPLKDLSFLKNLANLSTLVIGTTVENLEPSYLESIKNIAVTGYARKTMK